MAELKPSQTCKAADARNETEAGEVRAITRTSIVGIEDGCDLVRIRKTKARTGTYALDLKCSGYGEDWRSAELWSLREVGGRRILVSANPKDGSIVVYHRCTG